MSHRKGQLKIYLGYAAGVGKTYQMLDESQELKRRGVDVVIGYFEPHARKDTIAKTESLELLPRRRMEYRGAVFEEMDTEEILRRNPAVCLVDEFPHTNVPGAERAKRWEDVQVLLDAGIDVLTTMNVQHLESLNDQIWQITGIRVRETIPDWVMKQAAEVVMVDVTPRALLNRLERGVVYPPDKARKAVDSFFREPTLRALRELAMRQTAHEVDARQTPEEQPAEAQVAAAAAPAGASQVNERVLIHVTAEPSAAALIRRGKRVADYLNAECFAVCIAGDPDFTKMPIRQREAIDKHLNFARNLHIETRVLQGKEVAETLVEFARMNNVTQIVLGWPNQRALPVFGRNTVQQVVRLAADIEVTVVAERRHS